MFSSDTRHVRDVFDRCFVMMNERGKMDFNSQSLETDLERLVSSGYIEHCREILERKTACSAIAGLLRYMELLADTQNYRKWNIAVHDNQQYMRLDAAAMKALNVQRLKSDADDSFSLAGLLSTGRTAMGKRLVRTWLKQPLLKVEEIQTRLDISEA